MDTKETNLILTEFDGQTATLTLNRPAKRNALSMDLMAELREGIVQAERNLDCRAIILTAAGPAFCAGLDLNEAGERGQAPARALAVLYETMCLSALPIIAAATGPAMGGGVGVIAACDLAVVGERLVMGFPEVRRGLVAALVTCLVGRQVGQRVVREVTLLGQSIGAARALELGLVNRVAPDDQVLPTARQWALEIAAGAPGAIARTKRLLATMPAPGIVEDLKAALALHLDARDAAEFVEGVNAFKEKRLPNWKRNR